jgi:NAD(P)H dehydrogenase (quinone)
MSHPRIVITGANGQLGRHVIRDLQAIAPSARLIGVVRSAAPAADLAARGVELREADYGDPASLRSALTGADKLLLISSSEIGQRNAQHRNVVDAARAAGIELIVYTSILHADINPMALAVEHRETEQFIRASGLPFVFLRNGWYTENYTGNISAAIQHSAVIGAAGNGRISSAARADYALAAAKVLIEEQRDQPNRIYELAGDRAYTLAEYAAEITRQYGKSIAYVDMSEAEYKAALIGAGLPEVLAEVFAESDAKASAGALYDDRQALSRLIGRPTTSLAKSVTAALSAWA